MRTFESEEEVGAEAPKIIADLTYNAFLKQWSDAGRPSNQMLDAFLPKGWQNTKTIFKTAPQIGFIYGKILHIDTPVLSNDNSATDTDELKAINQFLARHPEIEFVYLQEVPYPIPRIELEAATKRGEGNTFLKVMRNPPSCLCGPSESKFVCNPALILKSEVFKTMLISVNMKEKGENLVKLPSISFETFKLISEHAHALGALEVNENNVADLAAAAHYLEIDVLLKRCNQFLSKNILSKNVDLDGLDWIEFCLQFELPDLTQHANNKCCQWLLASSKRNPFP